MSESKVQLGSKVDLFFVKGVLLEEALKAGKDLTPKENKDLEKVISLALFFSSPLCGLALTFLSCLLALLSFLGTQDLHPGVWGGGAERSGEWL